MKGLSRTMLTMQSAPLWRRWELPTWGIAVAVYGGWLALTWWHDALPLWALVPLGAYLVAWHGHLQHEALHGHPTRTPWINEALVFPALGLWYPYGLFRDTHLAHHLDWRLTCPIDDPESFYVTPRQWAGMGRVRRFLARANMTLAGRLVLGPPIAVWSLYAGEARRLLRGDTSHVSWWLRHAAGVALVLAWVVGVCGMSFWTYLFAIVWPATSLILLRSFAEHRPAERFEHRIAINHAEAPIALLFLNNNLHAVHHAVPALAWYDIPGFYRAHRAGFDEGNGGFVWKGYREQIRRFLFTPKEEPVHPHFRDDHCGTAPVARAA